jgi:hypothetical protein
VWTLGSNPIRLTTTTHWKVTYEQYQQKGYHLGCCKIQRNPKNKHKKEAKKEDSIRWAANTWVTSNQKYKLHITTFSYDESSSIAKISHQHSLSLMMNQPWVAQPFVPNWRPPLCSQICLPFSQVPIIGYFSEYPFSYPSQHHDELGVVLTTIWRLISEFVSFDQCHESRLPVAKSLNSLQMLMCSIKKCVYFEQY